MRPVRSMRLGWLKLPACVAAGLVLTERAARADIGVPMILAVWPASWLLLLLIVPIEAAVAKRALKEEWGKCLKVAAVANLVSTLVGIPVTWFLLLLCESRFAYPVMQANTLREKLYVVTANSPWMGDFGSELSWMVPAAAAVLCVPFFFMSVWIEYLTARLFFARDRRRAVLRWAWAANALSYGFLVGLLALDVVLNLPR